MVATEWSDLIEMIPRVDITVMRLPDERVPVIDREETERLDEWRQVYERVESRNDWKRLFCWTQDFGAPDKPERTQCFLMLILFREFSRRGISPFTKYDDYFMEDPPPLDWSKLPSNLSFLISAAERYGEIQFPADVEKCLENITPPVRQEFDLLIAEIERRPGAIDGFLNKYKMTQHPEAARVYFLWCLLAHYVDRFRPRSKKLSGATVI